MSSKTYIIAWDRALDNCLEIDRQLSGSGLEYKFLNVSSDRTERPNWELSDNVYYYGHFYNALRDFLVSGKRVFGFNAGDPEHPDHPSIIKKAERILEKPGIYAPNMAGDLFSEDGVYLSESKVYPELYLASQTNGVCMFMHRDVASIMFDFMSWMKVRGVVFSSMKSGWGLDTAYCLTAMYTNLPIYRDKEIYIDHPEGSSYNPNEAGKDMFHIETMFMQYASTRGWNIEALKSMKENIFLKSRQRKKYGLLLKTIYPNLEGDLEE